MKPVPHSNSHQGALSSQSDPGLPDDKVTDQPRVDEELAEAPDEKRNATDGYAPADDPSFHGSDQAEERSDTDVEP